MLYVKDSLGAQYFQWDSLKCFVIFSGMQLRVPRYF